MFAFRNNNTHRKVHSNNRKKDKSKEPQEQEEYPVQHSRHAPASPEPYDYTYDENCSVDMSLYTTQSKATVRYPPRLLNYGLDDGYEDSHDGMSCAPSEFTTEIAMKRYARLGGAWRPHTPLDDISPKNCWTPTSESNSMVRSAKSFKDDDSMTAASVLPSTAKMARIAVRDTSPKSTIKTPLIQNTLSLEASSDTQSPAVPSRKAMAGPVDLDVSVEDSESVRSSLPSLGDSPLRWEAPRILELPTTKKKAKTLGEDDDIYSFSAPEPIDVNAAEGNDDGSLSFSPSPLNESILDDDTYGFSVASEKKSVNTALSSVPPHLQVGRLELFSQWDQDSYQANDGSPGSFIVRTNPSDGSISMEYSTDSASNSNRTPLVVSPSNTSKPVGRRLIKQLSTDKDSLEHVIALSLSRSHTNRTQTSSNPSSPTSTESSKDRPSPQSLSPSSLVGRSARSVSASSNYPVPANQMVQVRTSTSPTMKVEARTKAPTATVLARRDQADPQLKPKTPHATSMVVEPDCGQYTVLALETSASFEQLDDDTYGYSTTSPAPIPELAHNDPLRIGPHSSPILVEDDEPDVWTDQRDEERQTAPPTQQVRDDVLDRTYQETMDTISFARRSHEFVNMSEEKESGVVRLTESELRKHLKKVQYEQPLPSSEIEGYDSWKRHLEQQQKYFAKLQAKVAREELAKTKDIPQMKRYFAPTDQRPTNSRCLVPDGTHGLGNKRIDSTRSAMDRSMDSTIPTIDDGKLNLRRKGKPVPRAGGGWGWFVSGQTKKKVETKKKIKSKNTSSQATENIKKPKTSGSPTEAKVVPLSQFMRMTADEPEEVAGFSQEPIQERVARLRHEAIENQRQKNIREVKSPTKQATTQLRGEGSAVNQRISVAAQPLAPCITCRAAERSYVAMPCMHFSFCEKCAHQLNQASCPTCPVCSVRDVTFTRVYIG